MSIKDEKKGTKIAVLGAGNVGATIAYTLTIKGVCSELVLVDIDKAKAEGEAMDIRQGINFCPSVDIYAGDYPDTKGADIVVISVGVGRKPGQSRMELAKTNVDIINQVLPEITKHCPDSVYVVVSNPVDILTYTLVRYGISRNKIIGTGTMLDSARLRSILADRLEISAESVHANVFGEHGDTSFVPWSLTTVAGMNMFEYFRSINRQISMDKLKEIETAVRQAGAAVIEAKGATYYAIALSVNKICECIIRDSRSVMTVSTLTDGIYGTEDVCLSLPYVIGADGVSQRIKVNLNPDEDEMIRKSSKAIKKVIDEIGI